MENKEIKEVVEEVLEEARVEEERLKAIYLRLIEDYCNVTFEDPYPPVIDMALEKLVETDPMAYGIQSEKLSDMATTYAAPTGKQGAFPDYIEAWLMPYRRPFIVSDKRKKPYNDGRR